MASCCMVDLFSTFAMLYPNMKFSLRLIRARPIFYMINDNPDVSLRIVDCSLYTRRIAIKDDYHRKRKDMLAYIPVEFNCLETLAKTFIIAARQNHFIHQNVDNIAPFRQNPITRKKKSAFTGFYAENLFWYQQFDSDKLEDSEEISQW